MLTRERKTEFSIHGCFWRGPRVILSLACRKKSARAVAGYTCQGEGIREISASREGDGVEFSSTTYRCANIAIFGQYEGYLACFMYKSF